MSILIDKNNSGAVQVTEDGNIQTLFPNLDKQGGGSGGGAVNSVNGQTGEVVLDASDVGALADNTGVVSEYVDLFSNNSSYAPNDTVTFLENPFNYRTFVFKITDTDTWGFACVCDATVNGEPLQQIRGYYSVVTSAPNVFIAFMIIKDITLNNGVYTGTLDTAVLYNKNTNTNSTNTKLTHLRGIGYETDAIPSAQGGEFLI